MARAFRRIISFFAKEINEVRRQPMLLAGLILGPFLILLLFGVGYTGERPTLRTALVVAPNRYTPEQMKQLRDQIGPTFKVADEHIFADENLAMMALRRGEVDIVEVIPPDPTNVFTTGQQLDVRITYNQIDPLLRDWIEYLAYSQINELNRSFLRSFVGDNQQRLGTLREYVTEARTHVATVREQVRSGNPQEARSAVQQLRTTGAIYIVALALMQQGGTSDTATSQSAQNLTSIQSNLDLLDQGLAGNGAPAEQEQRLDDLDRDLNELDTVADQVRSIDPNVLVSPLLSKTTNLAPLGALGDPKTNPSQAYVRFYTPAVLALLLQHMMVTLAALSLIRERMLGTIEVFRVSPLTAIQVIIGKYLGYTLSAVLIMSALLPLLVFGLGLPFPLEQAGVFVAISFLLVIASLGWGFLISAIVGSDSQAVQFSMLVLLLSVFFSGFFIPLKSFISLVTWVAKLLPVTHGIQSFQQILLLNQAPTWDVYLWLGGIALVSFLLSWMIFRRQFQRR